MIDIELHQPCSQISIIRFRNHYTYAITVLMVLYQSSVAPEPRALTQDHSNATTTRVPNVFKSHGSGPGGEWKVGVAKHVLMPSYHCESPDTQKWVKLGQSDFQGQLEGVVRLRLILRQPSPRRLFGIENFSCYHHNSSASTCTHLLTMSHDHEGVWSSSRNQMERLF